MCIKCAWMWVRLLIEICFISFHTASCTILNVYLINGFALWWFTSEERFLRTNIFKNYIFAWSSFTLNFLLYARYIGCKQMSYIWTSTCMCMYTCIYVHSFIRLLLVFQAWFLLACLFALLIISLFMNMSSDTTF